MTGFYNRDGMCLLRGRTWVDLLFVKKWDTFFTSPSSEMPIAHFTFFCLLAQRAALYSVLHFNARRSSAVACLGPAMKQAPAARTNLACFNSAWLRSESSPMMKSGLKSTFRTIVVCPLLRCFWVVSISDICANIWPVFCSYPFSCSSFPSLHHLGFWSGV